MKHENLGLGKRSEDDSNTVFERHESCDKFFSWEFLTRFGGIVKGETTCLSGAVCLCCVCESVKIVVANGLGLSFISLLFCICDCCYLCHQ